MKAILYRKYGAPHVLEMGEIPKPTPASDEVLIKVRATTVTAADRRARAREAPKGFGWLAPLVFGVSGPRQPILGGELAGEIEAVGAAVTRFKPGDPVFAFNAARLGCYVEYKCMPEDGALALKPEHLDYEEAAALSFGGSTALHFLRKAHVRPGQKVLVNGAAGGVGSAAVQLAKHFGAHVTGVCSARNLQRVRSIGADAVIDYTREDFAAGGATYDVIVDTVGTAPYSRAKHALQNGGVLLLVLATLGDLLQAPWITALSGKKVIAGVASCNAADLRFLAGLAESGQFKPLIDRRYRLEQIAEAHGHVDTGRKTGNVVITV